MKYLLDFCLPGLPSTSNSHKAHWAIMGEERKKWRSAVHLIAKLRRPKKPLTRAKITLTRFSGNRPDFDNLVISFKSVVDGLTDAGIILDDKDSIVLERIFLWEKIAPKLGKIRIQVEEIPT